jgi:hypothetical protein
MTQTSVLTKPYRLISFIPSVGMSEVTISERVFFLEESAGAMPCHIRSSSMQVSFLFLI